MAKVSVVMPVYGVEQYLEQSVDSVLNQTFSDIEIILIDDRSPDRCPEICEIYAKKDKRVKVIHHEQNKGLRAAEFSGVNVATSGYTMFVDSDDWVKQNFVETLYNEIETSGVDCVSSGFTLVQDGHQRDVLLKTTREFTKQQIEQEILTPFYEQSESFDKSFGVIRCSKIYKTALLKQAFENCNFKVTNYEDLDLNLRFLSICESVKSLSDYSGYFYRKGVATSMSSQRNLVFVQQRELVVSEMKAFAKSKGRPAKAFLMGWIKDDEEIKYLFWQYEMIMKSDIPFDEKMVHLKSYYKNTNIYKQLENSPHELQLYLNANMEISNKQKAWGFVVDRLKSSDFLKIQQKNFYYASYIFRFLESSMPLDLRVNEAKEMKKQLSEKSYLLEFSKHQPLMGKLSCIMVYLGCEKFLAMLVDLMKK